MVQYDCPYIDTSDDYDVTVSGMHWDFDTAARKLETRVLVQGEDRETLDAGLAGLAGHENMNGHDLLSRQGERALIRNQVAETDAMRAIRDQGGYLTGPFEASGGSERWHVGFDTAEAADRALADLDRENDFTVESRESITFDDYFDLVENVGPAKQLLDGARDLSDTERSTIERAYREGYFRTPRDSTLGALAEEFDVSRTAVSKNLRRGEQKLLGHVVDALGELDE